MANCAECGAEIPLGTSFCADHHPMSLYEWYWDGDDEHEVIDFS